MHAGVRTYLRETTAALFSNVNIIKKTLYSSLVVTLMVAIFLPTEYAAVGEIVLLSKKIQQSIKGEIFSDAGSRYIPASLPDIETENNIVRSVPLIKESVAQLIKDGYEVNQPNIIKDFLKYKVIQTLKALITGEEPDPFLDKVNAATEHIIENMEVFSIPGSYVTQVVYENEDPEVSAKFVNYHLNNYLEKRRGLILNEASDEFLSEKIVSYKKEINDLANEKLGLYTAYGVTDAKEELSILIERINQLEKELHSFEDNQKEVQEWEIFIKSQYEQLKETPATKILFSYSYDASITSKKIIPENVELKKLISKINDLQLNHTTLKLSFRKGSEKLVKIEQQLEQQKVRLIKLVENYLIELTKTMRVYDSLYDHKHERFKQLKERAKSLQIVSAKETGINIELEAAKEAYSRYSQTYQERRTEKITNTDEVLGVKILSKAAVPIEPSTPKMLIIIIIGSIGSLFIALAVGVIADFLDHKVRTAEELEKICDVPVIAVFDYLESVSGEKVSSSVNKQSQDVNRSQEAGPSKGVNQSQDKDKTEEHG